MTEKITVGVVGVGYLGRFHAQIYSRMPQVQLIGVADIDQRAAARVAEETNCVAFSDHHDLLDKVNAVSVVVPTSVHLEVTKPFLEQGVHVLLEKPIATSVAEAETVIQLAKKAGVILQIGHLERFNAGVMALAERISVPRFIEAHRMGGFVERATDVDVVSDLMIHDIDIILSLVNSELTSVAAVGTPVLTSHVDIANARLEFANGAVANVIASRVSENKLRRIRVFQENRYLSLDFIDQRLDIAWPKPRPDRAWPDIEREQLAIRPIKPLDAELQAFIDCVTTNSQPLVDGLVGLKALEVALQVKAAMARVPR